MGELISIASNPKFRNVNGAKIDAPIKNLAIHGSVENIAPPRMLHTHNDQMLAMFRDSLTTEDYLDLLESLVSPTLYGDADPEIQDMVDAFFGKEALADAE